MIKVLSNPEANEFQLLNPLDGALSDVLTHQSEIDSQRITRLCLEIFSAGFIAGSVPPYLPVYKELPCSKLFAAGGTASFAITDLWAMLITVKGFLGPKSKYEFVLLNDQAKGKRWYVIAVASLSVALGLFSQLYAAYPVLKYGTKGPFRWPGFIVCLGEASFVPICSIFSLFDDLISPRLKTKSESSKEIIRLQQETGALLDEYNTYFTQLKWEKKLALIEKLQQYSQDDNRVDLTLSEIVGASHEFRQETTSVAKKIAHAVGLSLLLISQATTTWYSYVQTEENITANKPGAMITSATSFFVNFYLLKKTMAGTCENIVDVVGNLFHLRTEKTLAEQMRPKLALTSKAIGLFVNLLGLGAYEVIYGDFFKSKLENVPLRQFLVSVQCLSLFALLYSATMQTIEDSVLKLIQYKGSLEEQLVSQMKSDIEKMRYLATLASEKVFKDFLRYHPAFHNALMQRISKASSRIDGAIELINVQPQPLPASQIV